MIRLSEDTAAYLRHITTVTPWTPDETATALPDPARALEAALYEATGRRGLPVLAGWVLGRATASALLKWAPPANEDRVLIAEHPARYAIFLDRSGRALSSQYPPQVLAEDPGSLVERLVVLDAWADPAFRLVALGRWGKALQRELGIPPIGRARGRELWVAPGRALIEEQWSETTIACANAGEVARCLRFASRKDIIMRFVASQAEPAPPSDAGDDPAVPDTVYAREEHGGTWRVDALREGAGFVQRFERYGEVIDRREVTPRRVTVATAPVLKGASPRLARYIVNTFVGRATSLTSVESLSRHLTEKGFSGWDVLLHIEERFGGLVREPLWPGPPSMRLGPWLMVKLQEELDAEGRGDTPDFETSPRTYPFLRWGEHELCLIGTLDRYLDHSVDPQGFVFLNDCEFFQLFCLSRSVLGMLEKTAFIDERLKGWGKLAALIVDHDLGDDFAEQARTTRIDEASDVVSTHHLGALSWIQRQPAFGPNPAQTRIIASTSEELVRLAQLARELAPAAGMSVATSSLEGQPRLEALHAAGLRDVKSIH